MAKAAPQGPLCKTVLPTNSFAKDKNNSARSPSEALVLLALSRQKGRSADLTNRADFLQLVKLSSSEPCSMTLSLLHSQC